jgi:hypothetical protein
MNQLPANVEVLVNDEHGCSKVPRPDGGMQPHTAGPKDNHIHVIVPLNALSVRVACPRQNGRTDPGGSSTLEELSPAGSFLFPKLWFFPTSAAFLGHV